jgi:pentatricopeptide repeat protein
MYIRGVQPDAASYSSAIVACDLSGDWQQALQLLQDMRERAHMQPDTVCYNCAIKACGSSGEWVQVRFGYKQCDKSLLSFIHHSCSVT